MGIFRYKNAGLSRSRGYYNLSDKYRKEKRLRQHIEHIIAELVRYGGARRARRRGLAAADWQALMSAAAYNLKWWIRRVELAVKRGEQEKKT